MTPEVPDGTSLSYRRPTLLRVLCILTFVAGGMGFLDGIRTYVNADVFSGIVDQSLLQAREKMNEEVKGDARAERVVESLMSHSAAFSEPANLKKSSLFKILANLIALVGAYLMFKMRRSGYWVYLCSSLVSIVSPLAVYGVHNLLAVSIAVILTIIGVVLAGLYALNIKHME